MTGYIAMFKRVLLECGAHVTIPPMGEVTVTIGRTQHLMKREEAIRVLSWVIENRASHYSAEATLNGKRTILTVAYSLNNPKQLRYLLKLLKAGVR